MSLWYCRTCQQVRGPNEFNICPQCGAAMVIASMNRKPDSDPAIPAADSAQANLRAMTKEATRLLDDNRELRAEVAQLHAALTTMTKERDLWKQWYESLFATRMTAPEHDSKAAEARLASLVQGITALRDQWRSTRHQHPEDRLIDAVLVDCAADLDRLVAEEPR